jgi:hypothetical protein
MRDEELGVSPQEIEERLRQRKAGQRRQVRAVEKR